MVDLMKIHSIKSRPIDCRSILKWGTLSGKRYGYLHSKWDVSCYIEPVDRKDRSYSTNKWVLRVPEMQSDAIDYPLRFGYKESAKKYANLREQARRKLRERLSQGENIEYQIERIPEDLFFDNGWDGKITVRKVGYDMPILNPFGNFTQRATVPLGMAEIAFCRTMESAQSIIHEWERAKRAGICENLPLVSIHAPHS